MSSSSGIPPADSHLTGFEVDENDLSEGEHFQSLDDDAPISSFTGSTSLIGNDAQRPQFVQGSSSLATEPSPHPYLLARLGRLTGMGSHVINGKLRDIMMNGPHSRAKEAEILAFLTNNAARVDGSVISSEHHENVLHKYFRAPFSPDDMDNARVLDAAFKTIPRDKWGSAVALTFNTEGMNPLHLGLYRAGEASGRGNLKLADSLSAAVQELKRRGRANQDLVTREPRPRNLAELYKEGYENASADRQRDLGSNS